jgi:hypothetical protein
MVLPQQVRKDEVLLLIEVPDEDRLGGLKRTSGWRPEIGRQGRRADDTLFPSKTGSDEQVRFPAAIPQHLHMTNLHGPRDLHHRLIEKTVQIGGFACSPAEIDKDAHVPADYLQFQRLLTCIVHHGLTLASRNGAKLRYVSLKQRWGVSLPFAGGCLPFPSPVAGLKMPVRDGET